MPKLNWDKIGERVYETGVDRGVLFVPNEWGNQFFGVPWNGLIQVDEDAGDIKVIPHSFDGDVYFNERTISDFSATIKAITYPDEFLEFDGYVSPNPGAFFDSQPVNRTFGLSYRTRIGNDVTGDLGYKIHLLYNLTALPSDRVYVTGGKTPDPTEFTWQVSGIPEVVEGYRPTCHVIFDSRKTAPDVMKYVEDRLYGTELGQISELLPLNELMAAVVAISMRIIANADGTITITGSSAYIQQVDSTTYDIDWVKITPINSDSVSITDDY